MSTTKRFGLMALFITTAVVFFGRAVMGATVTVNVAPGDAFVFDPASVSIHPGDTVTWVWQDSDHSATSGSPEQPSGLFDSGINNTGATFSYTFTAPGTVPYYCKPHGSCCGMVGNVIVADATPTPIPSPTPSATPAQLLNISTRLLVQSGDNVLIGGFIISGTSPKEVLIRAIGPSLANFGLTGVLADPVLELHGSDGSLITTNDNWKDSQETEIAATGLAPTDDSESAIIATLNPDSYTAVVKGNNDSSGIGLVEGYDLDEGANSQLANISTRGFVETGTNVMIAGFILGNGSDPATILIRALGPSLTPFGISDAMADPTLELHDENGALVMSNDNWKDTQETEIEAIGLPPQNDLESTILVTIPPTAHTAIVAPEDGQMGVGLVEVYRITQPQ